MASHSSRILLGQVVQSKLRDAAKVQITRLVLDEYVMQYFPNKSKVFAFDPKKVTKVGDIVLVKELEAKRTAFITHKIEKIIYSVGNVRDPITGRRCDSKSYWDEDERKKLFEKEPEEKTGLDETFAEKRSVYEDDRMKEPIMSLDRKDWKI
ncbi:small ribosomal subunit protein uS17m-like [Apostichopus japonicus]|uniref:small ribosomal subunit protein uS17m-like n=1 Tax=Stichopus japonicus TaxID=307972 RepID=UPI003AB81F24